MCGNSICQDRRFLHRCMPKLEEFFHYRNLDVSTLKELAARWSPELLKGFHKKAAHQALDDILESIDELKYYREHFIKVSKMNQIIAIALGGAFGAVMRFMISTGVYQWLGRGFPYGTLVVNLLGSFLIGLLTEALVLQRIASNNRISIGDFGRIVWLFDDVFDVLIGDSVFVRAGQFAKSRTEYCHQCLCLCLCRLGRYLDGPRLVYVFGWCVRWMGWMFPYALVIVNVIGAFLLVCFVSRYWIKW